MNRADLAAMLNQQTTACTPARAALLGGGDFVIWVGSVPGRRLAGIYAARLRRARKRGTETLALPATVDILTRHGSTPFRIGRIVTPDRTWAFMLFLAADADAVLACTGVRQAGRQPSSCSGDIHGLPKPHTVADGREAWTTACRGGRE